jgi:hypothetical protein
MNNFSPLRRKDAEEIFSTGFIGFSGLAGSEF